MTIEMEEGLSVQVEKPCPWCQGHKLGCFEAVDYGGYYVTCLYCDARGPNAESAEEAATFWDARS
jgi:hypothetical protein